MLATDALLLIILIYAAYIGLHRGFVLVGTELVGFAISATLAGILYHPVGAWVASWAGISIGLANVASFIIIWIIIELTFAFLVRIFIVPQITQELQHHTLNRVGGAVSSILRALILLALGLIVFAGLPLPSSSKETVTGSYIARIILEASSDWESIISNGLGHDLNSSLTVFTTSNDPESTERTDLGFKTTEVSADSADEDADLQLINHERTSRGLPPLTVNPAAQEVARAYAKRMLADGVFSHVDNDGHTPFDRLKAGNVNFGAAGENLALAPTLALAHQGLMNSPGHKANILSPDYNRVGIGVIDAGQYGIMVVQDFTD